MKDVFNSFPHFQEATMFVERALIDFGLLEEFEARPAGERAASLNWIAEAGDEITEEERVSQLLDALDTRTPLQHLYEPASPV